MFLPGVHIVFYCPVKKSGSISDRIYYIRLLAGFSIGYIYSIGYVGKFSSGSRIFGQIFDNSGPIHDKIGWRYIVSPTRFLVGSLVGPGGFSSESTPGILIGFRTIWSDSFKNPTRYAVGFMKNPTLNPPRFARNPTGFMKNTTRNPIGFTENPTRSPDRFTKNLTRNRMIRPHMV